MVARMWALLMMLVAVGTVWAQAPAPAVEPAAPSSPAPPSVPAAESLPTPDAPPAAAEEKKPNAAIVPVARVDNERWIARNQSFIDRAKQGAEMGDIDIIFMGDSITHQWETAGAPDHVHAAADARVFIPIRPETRSLNLSVSAGIALFQALRTTGGLP